MWIELTRTSSTHPPNQIFGSDAKAKDEQQEPELEPEREQGGGERGGEGEDVLATDEDEQEDQPHEETEEEQPSDISDRSAEGWAEEGAEGEGRSGSGSGTASPSSTRLAGGSYRSRSRSDDDDEGEGEGGEEAGTEESEQGAEGHQHHLTKKPKVSYGGAGGDGYPPASASAAGLAPPHRALERDELQEAMELVAASVGSIVAHTTNAPFRRECLELLGLESVKRVKPSVYNRLEAKRG